MARQLFTGNYGSGLGNYGMAGQLAAQRGQALGQAFQNVGQSVATAMKDYQAKKEQKEKKQQLAKFYEGQFAAHPEQAAQFGINVNDPKSLAQGAMAAVENPNAMRVAMGLQQMQVQSQQSKRQQQQEARLAQQFTQQQQDRRRTEESTKLARNIQAAAGYDSMKEVPERIKKNLTESSNNLGIAPEVVVGQIKQTKSARDFETRKNLAGVTYTEKQTQALDESLDTKKDEAMIKKFAVQVASGGMPINNVPEKYRALVDLQAKDIQFHRDKIDNTKKNWEADRANTEARTKYTLAQLEAGETVSLTEFERNLNELEAAGVITRQQKLDYKKGKVAIAAGVRNITKKDQLAIFGEQAMGAGITVKSIAGLVRAAENGDKVNGDEVKIKKGKIHVTDRDGNKHEITYNDVVKKAVKGYNNLLESTLRPGSFDPVPGTPTRQEIQEGEEDQVIDSAFDLFRF